MLKPFEKNSYLLLFLIFFLVCITGIGCKQTPGQKEKALVKKYEKLSQEEKNAQICELIDPVLHPSEISDTLGAIALIKAGADVNCLCEYTGTSQTFWSIIGLGRGKDYQVILTPTEFFFGSENIPLLDLCFQYGGKIDSNLIENTLDIGMWEYLFSKGWTLKNFRTFDYHIAQDKRLVDFLLGHGFGINDSLNEQGLTLFYALSLLEHGDDTRMFSYLLSKGADINFTNNIYRDAPIFNVAENKQVKVFKWMLDNGAGVKGIRTGDRETLPGVIIKNSQNDDLYPMLSALLKKTGHTELQDYEYVQEAISGENYKMLRFLLDNKAKVQLGSDPDHNAFEEAVMHRDTTSLKILLLKRPGEARIDELIKNCEYDIEFWASDPGHVMLLKDCLFILQKFKRGQLK